MNFTPTRKKALSLPVLSFKERDLAFVRFTSGITQSTIRKGDDDDRKPAMVAEVVNLETGEQQTLICPAALVGTLEDAGDEYIGRCYEIHVTPEKLPGKEYKGVTVYEIECPDVAPEA